MMIVVAFAAAVGGWFMGAVSAYLLCRWVDKRTPPNVDELEPGETWVRYDTQTFGPGDKLPGLDVRITDVGCELRPEVTKLSVVPS